MFFTTPLRNLSLALAFLFSFSVGHAHNFDKLWVLPSFDHGGGIFHNFMNVIGFLDYCEEQGISNYEVDFADKGHYYEKELGPNWWRYYFEPVNHKSLIVKMLLGFKRTKKRISSDKMALFVKKVEHAMSRERGHEIINKYIRLKPDLQSEIDAFYEKYFASHYVIGIHYRGTDKMHTMKGFAKSEAGVVTYEEVFKIVDLSMKQGGEKELKLFVATDSQEFLEKISERYPGLVITTPAIRSKDGKPLHYQVENAPPLYYYQQGKEAIIDCVLLSRCNFLIKTSSNLNFCSSLFNPHLESISLNERL